MLPTRTLALSALLLTLVTSVSVADATAKQFRVPVLLVSASGDQGQCKSVDFTWSLAPGSAAPLSVAIVEDSPAGAGESLRASVWLAATVAALDRLDDLSGVTVSVRVPGYVDGPSAGGAICLAILSALDGREFPGDCAMTGTILPDGTIGCVDGVALKMQAAAKASVRRVLVPAFLRFETDAKSGQQVDLKRLAASLKLEFIPVENITQAYRAAHRLLNPAASEATRGLPELSDATEDLLKRTYSEDMTAGARIWDAIPADVRAEMESDPLSRILLITPRAKADAAFRSGKLLYAADTASGWRTTLEGWRKIEEFFGQVDPDAGFDPAMQGLTERVEAALSGCADPESSFSTPGAFPPAAAQLCAGWYEAYSVLGVISLFEATVEGGSASLKDPSATDEQRQALQSHLVELKTLELLLASALERGAARWAADTRALAATLPTAKLINDGGGTERLFYSAAMAAHATFDHDVVRAAAQELKIAEEDALAEIVARDPSVAGINTKAQAGLMLHENLAQAGAGAPPFARNVAAHLHASNLAAVSGLIARWQTLEVSFDEQGPARYARTDLLNHLLRTARENALASIAACGQRGIPCVQAIRQFESAEIDRDDSDVDKVNVLAQYWEASLQAKTLLMAFGPSAPAPLRLAGLDAIALPPAGGKPQPAGAPAQTSPKINIDQLQQRLKLSQPPGLPLGSPNNAQDQHRWSSYAKPAVIARGIYAASRNEGSAARSAKKVLAGIGAAVVGIGLVLKRLAASKTSTKQAKPSVAEPK